MAKREFVISGVFDSSELKRSIQETANLIEKSFDKKGRMLFDKDTVKLLETGLRQNLQNARTYLSRLTDEAARLDAILQDSNTKEELRTKTLAKRLELQSKIVSAMKGEQQLLEASQRLRAPRGQIIEAAAAPVGGALIRTAEGLPVVGGAISGARGIGQQALSIYRGATPRISGALGGLGLPGGTAGILGGLGGGLAAGLGAGALGALGLAGFGAMRAFQGYGQFRQLAPTILQQRALGSTNLQMSPFVEMGFGETAVRQTQIGAMRAFGRTANEQGRTETLMGVARAAGMEPGQLVNLGAQLRPAMGQERANRELANLIERAFSGAIDKTQIPFFLEASTQLLSNIDKNGAMSTSALMSAMTSLLAAGNMSPEQAARITGGVQGAIAGSQGEANAFLQMAYARQGLGGGNLLGTQFAVRQGLLGINTEALRAQMGGGELTDQVIQTIKDNGLGGKDFTQKASRAITEQMDAIYGKGFSLLKARGLSNIFGRDKTVEELAKINLLLEKAAREGLTPKEQKTLEDLSKNKEDTWRNDVKNIMNSVAGHTAKIEAYTEVMAIALGEKAAPYFDKFRELQAKFDKGTGNVLDLFNELFGGGGKERSSDSGPQPEAITEGGKYEIRTSNFGFSRRLNPVKSLDELKALAKKDPEAFKKEYMRFVGDKGTFQKAKEEQATLLKEVNSVFRDLITAVNKNTDVQKTKDKIDPPKVKNSTTRRR